jgi:hypothetical protein
MKFKGIAFCAGVLSFASTVASASGIFQGYVQLFNYTSSAGYANTPIAMAAFDGDRQFKNYYGFLTTPNLHLNDDQECGGGTQVSRALVDLTNTSSEDTKRLISMLTIASTQDIPVVVNVSGCVNYLGVLYPKIVSVGFRP